MSHQDPIIGPPGPKGEQGRDGPEGKRGPEGPRGAMGWEGPRGPRGEMGIRGFDGERGPKGPKGERGPQGPMGIRGWEGPKGKDGKDGKDADISAMKSLVTEGVKGHESEFDHELIDPFLLGSYKLSEAGMSEGMFLKFDGSKVVYSTIQDVAQKVSRHLTRSGTSLPPRTGNVGKYLKVDSDLSLSWGTVSGSGTGDVEGPASATDGNVVLFDGATGKIIKDSGLTLSGTNTGDQNLFRTIAVSGQSDVVADSATDTLTLVAGSNITITTNPTTDAITIAASGGGGSGITRSVNSISSNTTAGATAATDYCYFVSGTTTLTMPTAVGNTNRYTVKNVGVGTVTVDTTGGQTIDGGATASLIVQYTSIDLISDGSNWLVV